MKIVLRQSGGITGLLRIYEIDTRVLPADKAAEIENLVETSGALTSKIPFWTRLMRNTMSCDLSHYSITIETAKGTHRLNFDDSTIPHELRSLMNFLRRHGVQTRE